MVAIKVQFVLTLFVGTALASPLANPLEVRDRVCYLYIFFIISLPPDSSPVDSLPQKHGRYPYVLALKYIYIYISTPPDTPVRTRSFQNHTYVPNRHSPARWMAIRSPSPRTMESGCARICPPETSPPRAGTRTYSQTRRRSSGTMSPAILQESQPSSSPSSRARSHRTITSGIRSRSRIPARVVLSTARLVGITVVSCATRLGATTVTMIGALSSVNRERVTRLAVASIVDVN